MLLLDAMSSICIVRHRIADTISFHSSIMTDLQNHRQRYGQDNIINFEKWKSVYRISTCSCLSTKHDVRYWYPNKWIISSKHHFGQYKNVKYRSSINALLKIKRGIKDSYDIRLIIRNTLFYIWL